jgi:hypothetical protein
MSAAKTGKATDREVLDDVARRLIEAHGITADELTTIFQGRTVPKNEGWSGRVEQAVLAATREMSAELLGRLIYAEPNAALYQVHCGAWLGKYEPGPSLLQQIAATAVICRIRALLGVCSGVTTYEPDTDALIGA